VTVVLHHFVRVRDVPRSRRLKAHAVNGMTLSSCFQFGSWESGARFVSEGREAHLNDVIDLARMQQRVGRPVIVERCREHQEVHNGLVSSNVPPSGVPPSSFMVSSLIMGLLFLCSCAADYNTTWTVTER
jgi:hypothetical protein